MPPSPARRVGVTVTADGFSPRAFRRGLRGPDITLTEHRVAVELCEYAGPDKPVVWPAIDTLAADCGLSRSATKRALNQLRVKGVIVCDGDRNGGRGHANRWRLIVKAGASDTLSNAKGSASEPLYGEERGSPQTKRGSETTIKGSASEPRSSKEEEEKREGSGAPPPPALRRGGRAPDPGSGSGDALPLNHDHADRGPSMGCPDHPSGQPDPGADCDACARACRKHDNWEGFRQQSWAEYAQYVKNVPEKWLADGPPLVCDRDHPVGAPCGACRDLRLMRQEWDKRRALWEQDRKDRLRDIDDCQICDSRGRVYMEGDPEPWFCDHGETDPPLSSFGIASSPVSPPNSIGIASPVSPPNSIGIVSPVSPPNSIGIAPSADPGNTRSLIENTVEGKPA
jgi:hypothetical protein